LSAVDMEAALFRKRRNTYAYGRKSHGVWRPWSVGMYYCYYE
jgi:hypothetical protein